jgi:hypothetical protein
VAVLDPWPFATVPDRNRASVWVGRPEVRRRLEGIMASWRRRRASDISVLWADFGQGKTHALLHLETSLVSQPDTLVHYVQLPPLTTGSPFVALYRQVLRDFPLDVLGKKVFARYRDSIQDIFRAPPPGTQPIHQLLWLVGTAGPGREIAARWLRGDKVTAAETANLVIAGKRLSVGASPQTPQDCQNVLDGLLQTTIDFPSEGSGQFVLLIDEFQRLGELTSRKRTEVCDALHLLFNRHPQGLRLVLAFAGGLPEIVDNVLTLDLQARVSTRLHLPPMTTTQAEAYLVDLVEHYCGVVPKERSFPYEKGAVSAIVERADPTDESLSPRKVNIAADVLTNEVLDERAGRGDVAEHPITRQEVVDAAHLMEAQLSMSLAAVD